MKRFILNRRFRPLTAVIAFLACFALSAPWPFPTTSFAQQSDLKSLLSTADQVLEEMSKTTGLPIKAPLKKQILGRPAIEKYLKESLHAEYTPEEVHAQEATLKAFGLVPADFDLEKFFIGFYTEQVAGLYDPKTKTMNMADWIPAEMQSMVLSHELTHALQDQNYDLDKFLHGMRDNDDATSARQAVAEGYAMAAMMQHMMGQIDWATLPSLEPMMAGVVDQQLSAYPAFSNAPYFFRLQALFPYLQGMAFMQRGLAHGGWKELNALFTNPPSTTKELFQPEVYYEHQQLPKVFLPNPAALSGIPALRLLNENTMGELGYFALIGQLISEDEAKSVATAWLGDRYLLYEYSDASAGGQKYALVARTKWASEEKATAFFRDYNSIIQKKYPGLAPDARSNADLSVGSVGPHHVIVLRRGDEVIWAEGIPAAQADAILDWIGALKI